MSTEFIHNCTTLHCGSENISAYGNDTLKITEETKPLSLGDILKLTFQVLIALFGVIGNVLVVIVMSRLRGKRRKPTEIYIQNLAIADLGILLLTFPLAAIKEKAPVSWPFGQFGCNFLSLIPEIFYGASVWCITVMALERHRRMLKVRTTLKSRGTTLTNRAKIVAGCVWVTSFVFFSFPLHFVVKYKALPNGGKRCGPVWPSVIFAHVYLTGFLTFFSYILPLAIISYTYFTISRVINKSNVFLRSMKRGQQKTLEEVEHHRSRINEKCIRLKQNKRAKKILTPVVLVFAATMLPLNIFRLVSVFWQAFPNQEYYSNLFFVVSVFVIINSSANPVIYSIASRDFGREIKKIRCGRRVGRSARWSRSAK